MMQENSPQLTFAMLDRLEGFDEGHRTPADDYPLQVWYRNVRETPIENLSLADIARASRQQIHIDQVVPVALRFLQQEPLAGDLYDGELLVSLKSVPAGYWKTHAADAAALRSIAVAALQRHEGVAEDLRRDVAELLCRIP